MKYSICQDYWDPTGNLCVDSVGMQWDQQHQGNETILVIWRKLLIDSAALMELQPCHSGRVIESELGHLEKEEWHQGGKT